MIVSIGISGFGGMPKRSKKATGLAFATVVAKAWGRAEQPSTSGVTSFLGVGFALRSRTPPQSWSLTTRSSRSRVVWFPLVPLTGAGEMVVEAP